MEPGSAEARLFAAIRALEARVADLTRRIAALEAPPADAAPPPPPPPDSTPFGPAESRADLDRHRNAVDRALRIFGILPAEEPAPAAAPKTLEAPAVEKHRRAMERAMDMFGLAPPRAPAPAEPAAPEIATPGEVVEPIPAPEFSPPPVVPKKEAPPPKSVDFAGTLPVELVEKPLARDYAAPILHALVLLAALGAGVYWAAERSPAGFFDRNWRELAGAAVVAILGVPALLWRRGPALGRSALAGGAAFLLDATVLSLLSRMSGVPPEALATACALALLAGAWLELQAPHPLGLLLGSVAVVPLPSALVPEDQLLLLVHTITAVASVAAVGIRVRTPQSGVLAGILAFPILVRARSLGAPPGMVSVFATAVAALLLGLAVLGPRGPSRRTASRAAALLAILALALVGWAVHNAGPFPPEAKAGALFLAGLLAGALASGTSDVVRGALKAGAVVLVLTALPVGFGGLNLAAAALAAALLFGIVAIVLADAYLRAAGVLVLVGACALLARHGPAAPHAAGAAAVGTLLYASRAAGAIPPVLRVLLGAIVVGASLVAVAAFTPPVCLGYAYLAAALATGLLAARSGWLLADAASAVLLGAGALWGVLRAPPPSPAIPLGAAAAVAAALALFRRPFSLRGASSLHLLLAELLLLVAAFLALPEPGGALAGMPVIALLAAPWWGIARPFLVTHARLLVFALLGRLLVVEAWPWGAVPARAFLDLGFLAALAGGMLALLVSQRGRRGTAAAAILSAAVVASAAWKQSAAFGLAAGSLAYVRAGIGGAIAVGLWAWGRKPSSPALRLAAAALLTLAASHAFASPSLGWDAAARSGLTITVAALALFLFARGGGRAPAAPG